MTGAAARAVAPTWPWGQIVIPSRCLRIPVEAHRVRRRRHARRQPGSDCRGPRRDLPGARPRAAEPRALALDRRAVAPPGVPRARSPTARPRALPRATRLPAPARRPAYREPLFKGAAELLAELAARDDVELGIATGKSRRGVAHLLDRHGWAGIFATIQTADDPSKPHPAMLEKALAETGADRRDSVMVGDSTFDMAMARDAGIGAIGVPGYTIARRRCAKPAPRRWCTPTPSCGAILKRRSSLPGGRAALSFAQCPTIVTRAGCPPAPRRCPAPRARCTRPRPECARPCRSASTRGRADGARGGLFQLVLDGRPAAPRGDPVAVRPRPRRGDRGRMAAQGAEIDPRAMP